MTRAMTEVLDSRPAVVRSVGAQLDERTTAASGIMRSDRGLFGRYLEIVNYAIADVRNVFPFYVVLEAFREALAGRPLLVDIVDDARGVRASVACSFEGSGLVLTSEPPNPARRRWKVGYEHILDVVAWPSRYLADPILLELPPFGPCTWSGAGEMRLERRWAPGGCRSCNEPPRAARPPPAADCIDVDGTARQRRTDCRHPSAALAGTAKLRVS